jgi:DNA-binding CsgD family transcriptional regulator/tetratricopeptide (TPR) repeat protein
MLTDQTDAAIDTLQRAIGLRRELGDVREEGEALQQLANVLWCPGRVAEARDATLQAIALLEEIAPGHELAMAYCRMTQLCMDAEDTSGAVAWSTRALNLAQELAETQTAVHALSSVGTARLLNGEAEGRQQIERSLALATDAGLDEDIGRAMTHLVWTAQRRREYTLALDYLEPALKHVSDHGNELLRGYLLAYRAQVECDLGRWQDAVDTAALVLREPRRSRVPRIIALATIARVRARRGDPEVWPLLDQALALAQRGEELQADAPVASARAEASWLVGDLARVARATESTLALARHRRSRWVVSELVAWRRRAGIVDAISRDEVTGPFALEIAGQWSAAAVRWRELGCPYEAALALASTDDQQLQRRALDQLQGLEARPAAAIVARRLRQRGARRLPRGPRPQTRANPAGLTARELEVLPLLAAGLRNAQIAKRLVVSEKTVTHHVSAILRKLDVKTRGEAAAKAIRLGLTGPT